MTCECGRQLAVDAGMAGGEVVCSCGRRVAVPTLGELRRQSRGDAAEIDLAAKGGGKPGILGSAMLVLAVLGVVVGAVVGIGALRRGPAPEAHGTPKPAEPGPTVADEPGKTAAAKGKDAATEAIAALLAQSPFAKHARDLPQEIFGGDRAAPTEEPDAPVPDPAATFGTFCSTCHVLPPPDVEPRRLWPAKIRQMYRYARGPRPQPPEKIPPIKAAIAYWSSRAPEDLTLPSDAMGSPQSPLPFARHEIVLKSIPSPSAISCVNFCRLSDEAPVQVLLSDMGHGLVVLWTPSDQASPDRVLARIPHPSRTHVVDLDRDGLRDILVANLGDFWPVDTTKGSVVWLRNRGGGQFEPVTLIDGLGRVNDVQAADFDGDGDLDLVVAVFGNLTTGMILYLENVARGGSLPEFEPMPVDRRTGTTDVLITDINQDGHADFISLQAQEHEHVLAFLNRGWGSFQVETVYKAPHPRWGSTGIRLIDLDGDGDLDVLFNHGDAFQFPAVARPYHGVSWLENRGTFPFLFHRLTHLPGAQTSLPGDLDGDGRIDVVSSAFIPGFNPKWLDAASMDSVVWLRQIAPGEFRRYSLETGLPYHACGEVGDYDGDGDLDIVLGNFFVFPHENVPWNACLVVLENLSPPRTKRGGT
ncbi:MAG: FG-GAP-like repeat-containing protein [Thermoguttaceae bacterium]|nr:FG-GAP-like repeat-containing protein [Thermoguttaceae bacterium]